MADQPWLKESFKSQGPSGFGRVTGDGGVAGVPAPVVECAVAAAGVLRVVGCE
jgi:hypothetical protein